MNKYQEALDKVTGSYDPEYCYPDEVNLLQELVNKETPMKMTDKYMRKCPKCGKDIAGGHDLDVECMSYCFECGQHLDWSEDEK